MHIKTSALAFFPPMTDVFAYGLISFHDLTFRVSIPFTA